VQKYEAKKLHSGGKDDGTKYAKSDDFDRTFLTLFYPSNQTIQEFMPNSDYNSTHLEPELTFNISGDYGKHQSPERIFGFGNGKRDRIYELDCQEGEFDCDYACDSKAQYEFDYTAFAKGSCDNGDIIIFAARMRLPEHYKDADKK